MTQVAGGAKTVWTQSLNITVTEVYPGSLVRNSIQGAGNTNTTRVGRWMLQAEYDNMVKTGKVQMSPNGNTSYVANPADINVFGKQAKPGSIYVEFDVDTNSIFKAGTDGWGQIGGPGSLQDRYNKLKGLPPITEMPDATNIQIKGKK